MVDHNFPIGLIILDFLPTIGFLVGAYYLTKVVTLTTPLISGWMVMAGASLITTGGLLKAVWKLIYSLGAGDIRWMSEALFILQAPGFLLLCIAVIQFSRRGTCSSNMPILAIVIWKLPLLLIMTICSLSLQGLLCRISLKRHAWSAAVGFALSFLGLLVMGGLASKEQTISVQWISEITNTIAQAGFLLGNILLYHNLKDGSGITSHELT